MVQRTSNGGDDSQGVPALIPMVMKLNAAELQMRLDWIDLEIEHLSTSKGVTERIQALQYSRAQLLATQAIIAVMRNSKKEIDS
jgi:hypothetical protein